MRCFQISQIIKIMQFLINLSNPVIEPSGIDVVRSNGVTGPSLLHEFSENACHIGIFPLISHFVKNPGAGGAGVPIRDNGVFLDVKIVFFYFEGNKFALIHHLHIFKRMAAKLGEGRGRLRMFPLFTDDQFAFTDIEHLSFHQFFEKKPTQYGR